MKVSDEKIILSLLQTGSPKATAKELGITETTIYNRRRKPSFKERYQSMQDDLLESASAMLKARMHKAIRTAERVLDDPESSGQTKLNASQMILNTGLRYNEQADILRRLKALEDATKADE